MVLQISEERNKEKEKQKKEIGKAYGKYAKQFTPRPKYFSNCVKAFISGGLICMAALAVQNRLEAMGLSQKDAGSFVTIGLIMIAQLLTGLGVFDVIAKYAGAGVIVPITGFANSVAASAIEYKKEGQVFGIGCKIFTIAGPVILYGIFSSWVLGLIYWLLKIAGIAS